MNDESSVIEKFEHWAHQRHQNATTSQENPQETHMTRIADAKAAIDRAQAQLAGIGSNQLAEAIADAGLGTSFTPGDIGLVLAVIRAIEHGPGLATPAAPAQQPEQQLQPQQTA